MKLRASLALAGLTLALLALAGCTAPATSTAPTDNTHVTVEKLFTDPDGYTIKRFEDAGVHRYYVTPGPSRMVWQQPAGKTSYPVSIDTLGASVQIERKSR